MSTFPLCKNLPVVDARPPVICLLLKTPKSIGARPRKDSHVAGRNFGLSRPRMTTRRRKMPSGTVKWFNTTKGYGFIAPDDGGADVFVHISAVEQSGLSALADDQKLTFDLIEGRDGRKMAGNLALTG
jgi:CspA family cold shock protein